METKVGKGNFIDGQFIKADEDNITSKNPAQNSEPVFKTGTSKSHVSQAVLAAKKALKSWTSLSPEKRIEHLSKLKTVFQKYEEPMAQAISTEMGKIYSESLLESKNLSARIDLTAKHGLSRVATEKPEGILGETRYHAQGVLAVLGPYNFPAHLVNAHVIPALMTGNTVVVKFSEICPWVGEIYAECIQEAGLPNGVFNMVQGDSSIGESLVKNPLIRGILFTGSYSTGRKLSEAILDEPHKILALEMGGKNTAVVLKDADLFQALSEIVQGAFLTTGQRCTATSRVLVEKQIAHQLIDALTRVTKNLKPGDPFIAETIFGPLAHSQALERFSSLLQNANKADCEVLVPSQTLEGGAFVTPSLHLLNKTQAPGYIDTELFGPDIAIEVVADFDDAISKVNESQYGLSNALFTKNESNLDAFYHETNCGILNLNRSTNGAHGSQPFGGVGKSGNQRAAGIDAVRYTTYPVAVNHLPYSETKPMPSLAKMLEAEKTK